MARDPFDVLGLPPGFRLDAPTLERAFLSRVARLHPDALGGGGDDDGGLAAEINEARAALANPERRANALLARLGGPGKEADRALPGGFLGHIMEVREEIERDLAASGPEARERWMDWAAARRDEYMARVDVLFAGAGDPPAGASLVEIRRELNAWRYLERLVEQLDPGYNPAIADW